MTDQKLNYRMEDAGKFNLSTAPHYSVLRLDNGTGRQNSEAGMDALKAMFPEGKVDAMNLVMFSTSGVHGSYVTLEEIEETIEKYGDDFEPSDDDEADDFFGYDLTVLVVHARLVCLRYGNVRVRKDDIPFLKKLRKDSIAVFSE